MYVYTTTYPEEPVLVYYDRTFFSRDAFGNVGVELTSITLCRYKHDMPTRLSSNECSSTFAIQR